MSTTNDPYTSAKIRTFLENEQTLFDANKSSTTQTSIALAAQTIAPKSRKGTGSNVPTCTNCEGKGRHGRGHSAKYCIQQGGGMAGKTIEESRAARLAEQGKPVKDKEGMLSLNVKDKQGRAMVAYIDPKDLHIEASTAEFAGLASTPVPTHSHLEEVEWVGWMALGEPRTKLDWNEYSRPADESTYATIGSLQQTKRTPVSLETDPFYVDTGASVHISFDQCDFLSLRPIPARSVKGVGGSSIIALGMGDIRLRIARGA